MLIESTHYVCYVNINQYLFSTIQSNVGKQIEKDLKLRKQIVCF